MDSAREGDELPATRRRWPDEAVGPWTLTLLWRVIDGRPECVGLVLAHEGGSQSPVLTGSALRALRLPEIVAAERAQMLPLRPQVGAMRKSTADRLRAAADIYRTALGEGRKPTKAVAEHFGITPGGASNLISRARTAGLLPPTSAGVPMG